MIVRPQKHTTDEKGIIRPDFLFSDWMFMWAMIYLIANMYSSKSKLHKYIVDYANPLIIFIVALIENGYLLGLIIFQKKNWVLATKFIIMLLFTKIIPIYLLYKKPINIISNILIFCIIFLIYNLHLYINNTNVYKIYENTNMYVLNNESKTPFFMLIHYFFGI
jgi:hypothetical protein